MNSIPLISLIFQGIPEQIAVVTLAFVIAKVQIDWRKIIPIGFIQVIVAYTIRQFPIPFGLHTILLIILLFLFILIGSKGEISLSFLGSVISFLILILFELISSSVLMPLIDMTPETLISDPVARTLMFEPQVILLFLCAYSIKKFYTKKDQKDSKQYEYF